MSVLLYLMRSIRSYKRLSMMFILSITLEVAYGIAAPLSFKFLVDIAFIPRDFHAFVLILLALMVGGVINIGGHVLGDYSLGRLAGEIIRGMRTELFAHLQNQSLPFYRKFGVGDLVARFSSDMTSIERVIRSSSPLFLKETFSVLLGLGMLFALEWKLTLAMLGGASLMFIAPRFVQGRAADANRSFKESQERFIQTIDELVKGHKTIKSLHQEPRFQERARGQINELFTLGFKLQMLGSLLERLPLTVLLLLNGIMIGFGGYLIFQDELSVGSFMAFFTLFLSVGQSATNLSYLIPGLIDSGTSFGRIREVLEVQPTVQEKPDAVPLPQVVPSITMQEVTFGYTEAADQLTDISLHIEPGSYTAFVGPSGSGKSTALQLLSRFYDPKRGTVSINQTDLRQSSEASLRELSTYVTQDTYLFHSTIRDNLLLGRTDLTEEQMINAARQAKIHDIIMGWPDGYDTIVHHDGGSLSGGERQRLSIARALLRNPKLLLLDEVTAALDPATESEIHDMIEGLRTYKTIVAVTHRLSSVVNADHICVFQNGRIVESGNHSQLLLHNGLYAAMWEKQHGFHLSRDGQHATVESSRLSRLPVFQGLDASLLDELVPLFTTETFQAGMNVVNEGELGSKMYIIVRGTFEVLKRTPGREDQRVAVLQDGDHFGEIALLRNIPRTATVRALCPSVVLSIRQEAFYRLTSESPQFHQAMESALQNRI